MKLKLFFIFIVLSLAIGCSKEPSQPNVEVIQDMMEQPALKAQDFMPNDREKSSMRIPPKGSWPKNVPHYPYVGKEELAAKKLKNPYKLNKDPKFIASGKTHYNNYCMVCHGPQGKADGPVAAKFNPPKPPSLVTDAYKKYSDGRIFHIITEGKGYMGTYIHQLPKEMDRWAVVNYIRTLQTN